MFRTVPLSVIRSSSLYTQQWYMSYRFADSLQSRIRTELRPDPALQAVWHIPLPCVQWKILDDGQRNCPKHAEFYPKNKIWQSSASSWFSIWNALYVSQDITLLPNIQVRYCTYTTYRTFYWSSLSVLSSQFKLRWGSRLEFIRHRVRIHAVPSANLTLLCLPQTLQVKAGMVPGTGHDRFLAMLCKFPSTSHYTRSKI